MEESLFTLNLSASTRTYTQQRGVEWGGDPNVDNSLRDVMLQWHAASRYGGRWRRPDPDQHQRDSPG